MGLKLTKKIFGVIGRYLNQEVKQKDRSYLSDFDRISHEVIPGDVLLVEGTARISKIIKRITLSHWTHSALYIGRLHGIEDPNLRALVRKYYRGSAGKQLIIESLVGEGTVIQPLNKYKGHHVRICRPTGLSHSDAQKVIGVAIHHLGNQYSARHFFDLGRFLLSSHILPRRWGSSLFKQKKDGKKPNQAAHDICSSMIAESFLSIDFPVLPLVRESDDKKLEVIHRNPKLFAPSDFDYSPYFAIIKYPIFSLSGRGPYQSLPWHKGLLSNDEGLVEPRPKKKKDEASDDSEGGDKTN